MTTATTSAVYINVIEDVVSKVRDDFARYNVDESVLNELQGMWEMKMMQCGVICGPIERPTVPKAPPNTVGSSGGGPTPVHDLNVPYEPTEEYETPTAELLFPATPGQTPMQTPLPGSGQTPLPGNIPTPLPGSAEHSMYQLATPSDYTSGHDSVGLNDVKPGRPSPYMQAPSPWMNQRPALGVDVNVAYVEGRDDLDRGNPQPMTQDFFTMSAGKRKREDYAPHFHGGGYIPQQDGAGDANTPFEVFHTELYPYQGVASEDYNAVQTPANLELHTGTPNVGAQNEVDEDDEPPLNENDDDDLDDGDEGEEPNTQHLVLAQFDKVTRTKSRWKCTLKDGIMRINNKDILFTKATGEFEF